MNKPIVMNCQLDDGDCPAWSVNLEKKLLYRFAMASILGRIISPKPAALGSILLGSWAYGAAAGARHLSAEVGQTDRNLNHFFKVTTRVILTQSLGCTPASGIF